MNIFKYFSSLSWLMFGFKVACSKISSVSKYITIEYSKKTKVQVKRNVAVDFSYVKSLTPHIPSQKDFRGHYIHQDIEKVICMVCNSFLEELLEELCSGFPCMIELRWGLLKLKWVPPDSRRENVICGILCGNHLTIKRMAFTVNVMGSRASLFFPIH